MKEETTFRYGSMVEALNALKKRGYTYDFNLRAGCIDCGDHKLKPDQFRIDVVYRFEGDSDPADESIVYGISSLDDKIKGVLVNAFGIYSEDASDELISKLKVH